MMEKKGKYMPIWGRYVDMFLELSDKKAGMLVRAMVDYFFNDVEPELPGELVGYWVFLKYDLNYARERYETKVRNGRKGGRPKKVCPEETESNQS